VIDENKEKRNALMALTTDTAVDIRYDPLVVYFLCLCVFCAELLGLLRMASDRVSSHTLTSTI